MKMRGNVRRTRRRIILVDVDGKPVDDVASAVAGELHDLDDAGTTVRRTRFFLTRENLPWLPVSEPVFLLWVLTLLVAVWGVIALALKLT